MDQSAFFSRFNEGEAVPYFYEPFLEAFDPDLRKQLGVWYTPAEVVRYMVARVDRALKDDLGIPDGLAAENVYVLDPCCGTGAYLAEVLRRIAANLEGRGVGALSGARVKQAATERVFGFEIMPAPFVVAHLQVGLTMQNLDAPLADDGTERAGIFLTNALTGWEPTEKEKQLVAFPEMAAERDRANQVKRDRPILVILGNPPYNGFAGIAVDEERELSEAYRSTGRVRRPEGQGLNDLYVRFFRMSQRRIVEKTGRGVVCFFSNYSWLDGLSFTGMRERYLDAFDAVRIDCLNGDKYKTGKVAPDGSPDPSIFSIKGDSVGIQLSPCQCAVAVSQSMTSPRISPEDVVQDEPPDHRTPHEAQEHRCAGDVLGLLRKLVIVERDSVDGRLHRGIEQLRDQHEQHRVDEQRDLHEGRWQGNRNQHQHRRKRKLLPERRFVSKCTGESRERVEQRAPYPDQACLALLRARPILWLGHSGLPSSDAVRRTGVACVMEVNRAGFSGD